MRVMYRQQGSFAALNLAREHLKRQGFRYGRLQRGYPAIIWLDPTRVGQRLPRWSDLTPRELRAADGEMSGAAEAGPIRLELPSTITGAARDRFLALARIAETVPGCEVDLS